MWQRVRGHDQAVERFRGSLRAGRLASTYLLVGPSGVGKRTFANAVAKAMLCTRTADSQLESCGECDACRLFAAENHPDFDIVQLPEGKRSLPVELFIGDREHRNRAGLCHSLSLKPQLSNRRVAVIDDADRLTVESSNALLKTLEEPPEGALLLLLATSRARLLTTILSRCQVVRFDLLPPQEVAAVLIEHQAAATPEEAAELARLSGGSVETAMMMADGEVATARAVFLDSLSSDSAPSSPRLAAEMNGFLDGAGKETARRRNRLRVLLVAATEHFGTMLRASSAHGDAASQEAALECLDATLSAEDYLDRNSNLNTLVDWWADRLAAPMNRSRAG
ncbi:MAG: DNA polymerase III subunit delta' [Planctomycetota bacterium]